MNNTPINYQPPPANSLVELSSSLKIYNTQKDFSPTLKALFKQARTSCETAYAPYSKFHVGAAVLLQDGTIIGGNNQENAAYPSGLCAERVALFAAGALHPQTPVVAIAITVDYDNIAHHLDNISPCGSCRQVLAETEHRHQQTIDIYLLGRGNKIALVHGIETLLPLIFNGSVFNK